MSNPPQPQLQPQQFDTTLLDPAPPTSGPNNNTCIGTSKKGSRCKKQLNFYDIQRTTNLVTSLRFMDPRNVEREHLTLGERGCVLDCFCARHAEQAADVMWAWLEQIRGEGKKVQESEDKVRRERVENWLRGVEGEAQGEDIEGEHVRVEEAALSSGSVRERHEEET